MKSSLAAVSLRWVLEQLFDEAGASLSDHVTLEPLSTLARHAWSESERLDLHADLAASADAIPDRCLNRWHTH